MQAVGGWADRGRDLVGRWKPPPLESDLRALGEDDPAALPLCTDLPPHATVAAACGCLDVGYGDRTGKMGRAFRATLTAFAALLAIRTKSFRLRKTLL